MFGAPFPEKIPDEFFTTPLTSYGTQKAIGELLLADYTRKGMIDGVGIRLPTICVRPGKPNKAASGFFSNIIREPLAGHEAVLPVSDDVMHWHASPRAAVGFLLHAATIDGDKARGSPQPLDAGPRGDRRRPDRGPAQGCRREGRRAHPPRARCIRAGHRRGLAARASTPSARPASASRRKRSFEEIIRVHVEDELRRPDRVSGSGCK